ncbi:MAG: hypothetical protein WAL91_11015 [Propionicimonas sp.]
MKAVRISFTIAAVLAMASVVMGAVVCATESGAACPNWPGCYPDRFAPQAQLNPMIEFVHRVVAALTGPAVLVAAILARKVEDRLPRRLAWVALAGTIAAGVFGMLIVKVGIPWWLGVVDLASALTATVCLILATLLVAPDARWVPGPIARPAWAALVTLAVMHLLAIAVAGANSFTRCLSCPLGVWDADRWPGVQWLRIGLAVVAAVLIVVVVVAGLRVRRLRVAAAITGGLLLLEAVLGIAVRTGSAGIGPATALAVTAALLFGAMALLAGRASVVRTPPEQS